MKHRLFWKFLLAFWLALLMVSTLAALGGRVLEQRYREEQDAAVLEGGPRAALLLDSAQATLLYAGADAMRRLLQDEAVREHDLLYVVDENRRDALGRTVPVASLAEAERLTADRLPMSITGSRPRKGSGHGHGSARRVLDRVPKLASYSAL